MRGENILAVCFKCVTYILYAKHVYFCINNKCSTLYPLLQIETNVTTNTTYNSVRWQHNGKFKIQASHGRANIARSTYKV